MKLTHEQALGRLRVEGFAVDNNPDLIDILTATGPYLCGESARLQVRYWDLRLGRNSQELSCR